MRTWALIIVLASILGMESASAQSPQLSASPQGNGNPINKIEASRIVRLDSMRRVLGLSPHSDLRWIAGINRVDTLRVIDNFNRTEIGEDWRYDQQYWTIVNGEMSLTPAAQHEWRYLAVFRPVYNNAERRIYSVSYRWGKKVDALGIREGAMALMLDEPSPGGSGYWLWARYGGVWLWIIKDGTWEYTPNQGKEVDRQEGKLGDPIAGDVVTGLLRNEKDAIYFDYYINGEFHGTVKDFTKEFPQSDIWHVGLFLHGQQLNNQVDDFTVTWLQGDGDPPATVTDLEVLRSNIFSVTLQWTSPGDNGYDGRANHLELRYSTSPITPENFSAATLVPDIPSPSDPGQIQQFTVNGLKDNSSYYFALRVFDEADNASGLSNVVQANTLALVARKDDFNRPNGALGDDWIGDLTNLQIRNNTVQNLAVGDLWSPAVFRGSRNVVQVTLKYGPAATTYGINFSGVLVMADAPSATPSGYLIQRHSGDTPNITTDDRTRLWLVQNGRLVYVIDQGQSQSPHPPRANSRVTVRIVYENNVRYFYVYVDDAFDRVLSDPAQMYNGLYAGFMLESTLGEQNAVDEFIASAAPGSPQFLSKVSGDNQFGAIGQPLPLPLTVSLIDSFNNPLPGALIKFAVTTGTATITPPLTTDGHIRIEAEDAQITPPLEKRNDAEAAGGQYIVYPTGQSADASATFTFEITKAGTYRLWTRSLKMGVEAGSWFVSVNGGPDFVYDVFRGKTQKVWTWDLVSERGSGSAQVPQFDPKLFNLSAGKHTIVFKARWDDTRLDKILITADSEYVPNGKEEKNFVTNAFGQASANVTLGETAGLVTIQASHGNLPPVTFTATASGGPAAKVEINGGNHQSGPAGQTLPHPFQVMVQDKNGNGVAGQPISWVVTSGNGTLSQYTSITGMDGIAATTLTLGNSSATNTVEARTALPVSPISFTATTTSGLAAKVMMVSGNSQSGTVHAALAVPLVAKVATASGQAVANFPVEFNVRRGGGSLSPHLAISNESFEIANPGANTPANWALEGAPSSSEILLAGTGAYNGVKSLQVNSNRDGVGVSQVLNYSSAGYYTLTFWAKVVSGTARVTWRLNDASGNVVEKIIDVTPIATGNAWTPYVLSADNGAAVPRSLSIKTFGGPGNFFIDEMKIARNTDSNGEIAVSWTLGDTAMTQVVQAEAKVRNTVLAGSPLAFSAIAKPGPAKKIIIASGNNQSGAPGQPLRLPIVVKVIDQYRNSIANRSVKFTVKAGGCKLNGTLTSFSTTTNAEGLAQATLQLGPTPGDTNKVEITSTGLSPVMVVAVAAIPNRVTKVPGALTTGSASQRLSKPFVVRVADANNQPIFGYPVIFNVRQGNGRINDSTRVTVFTDSTGEARAFLTLGPTPGAYNKVEAYVKYNNQNLPSPPLTFVVKAAKLKALVLVSGNHQTGNACEPLPQPFKVKVLDSLDVGIKNQSVTFSILGGGGKLANGDTIQTVSTDSSGIAQLKLTLGPTPGTNQVTAKTTTTLAGSPQTFIATGRLGPAAILRKFAGDSLTAPAGTVLPSPVVALVTDKCGNAISGVKVTFIVKAGGGKVNGKDTLTVISDGSGKASVSWQLGSLAGKYNNKLEARAFNGNTPLTNSPLTFVASATPKAARAMIILNNPAVFNGRAGETLATKLMVKVTDGSPGNGNAVPGHLVRFTVVRGGGNFNHSRADTMVSTDQNGVAQINWTLGGSIGTNSQEVRATSTNGLSQLQGSPLVFTANVTAGLPSNQGSYVEATSPIPADDQTKSKVTIYVRDRFGNPIAGEPVMIVVSGGTNTIEQPVNRTNAQGIATGAFTSKTAGVKTVTAKIIEGITITRGDTVQVNPLAANRMSYVSGHNQACNIQAAGPKPLVVKVGDKYNNGVPEYDVRFVVKGEGRIWEANPIKTDSAGLASATFIAGTNTGQSQVWAEAPGLNNSPVIFLFNVTNTPAQRLHEGSGNGQRGQVGQILIQPLVVRVTDSFGRPVFGVPVKFDVTFGGGTVDGQDPLIVKSNELGEARGSWRLGPLAGVNTIRVESEGLFGSPIDFRAEATPGPAERMEIAAGQRASGPVGMTMGQPLVVRITDATGNGVDDVPVLFELVHGTGSLSSREPVRLAQVTSKNGGLASVQITYEQDSGWRHVRASAEGLRDSPRTFYVYGRALAAQTMTAIDRTNNQRGTKGKSLNFPLQVLVQDRLGNPVPNETVTYLIIAGGGNFEGNPLLEAKTDSNGIASAIWTLGRHEKDNVANALHSGVMPSSIIFKATGFDNNFPVFADVPDRRVTEGDVIEFAVSATDADGEALTYRAKNLPPHATFDSLVTRVFRWATDQNSAGHYEVSFLVFDPRGGVDEELVIIDVKNRNSPPLIHSRIPVGNDSPSRPDTVIELNATLLMQVNASDPDKDELSYRWFLNGRYAGSATNTFLFRNNQKLNTVEVLVFDQEDTVRSSWLIQVPVKLVSFSATQEDDGATGGKRILLEWRTTAEFQNAGFNILRSRSQAGNFEKINPALIPARRDGQYTFVDDQVEAGGRYFYKLEDVDVYGNVTMHGPLMIEVAAPQSYALRQNYPNPFGRLPFNPTTQIRYELPRPGQVTLVIFNALGQQVRRLVERHQPAGYYMAVWNGRDQNGKPVPSGIYYYRLQVGEFVETKKMVVAK